MKSLTEWLTKTTDFFFIYFNAQRVLVSARAGEPVSEPVPGVFGSLDPEPLEKKTGAGAAWKKRQEPELLKI